MKNFTKRRNGDNQLRMKVYSILMNNKEELELDETKALELSYFVSVTYSGLDRDKNEIKNYVKLAIEMIENEKNFNECIKSFNDNTLLSKIKETVKQYQDIFFKLDAEMKKIAHYTNYESITEIPKFTID